MPAHPRLSFRLGARAALAICAALLAVYAAVIHPWLTNWGATMVERSLPLPGDGLNPDPRWQTTRAVTIHAPPAVVWAWLIQHGQDRAGFYSYDWLENLTGADIHNVNEPRAEWQQRAVGDAVPMARPDLLGGRMRSVSAVHVASVEPGRALVEHGAGNDSGAYVLRPVDGGFTRLIVRERNGAAGGGRAQRLAGDVSRALVRDPMHFVMQRRMLLGIKARAEGRPNPPAALDLAARAGWAAAGAALLGLFLRHRRTWPWLALPAVTTLPALLGAGDADAALAGFLAVGITMLGAVRFGRQWWPALAVIGAGVLLVLLFAPDAYVVFGLIFTALLVAAAGRAVRRVLRGHRSRTLPLPRPAAP